MSVDIRMLKKPNVPKGRYDRSLARSVSGTSCHSGEAASDDSLGLSERPVSAGSAALGIGVLMGVALKALEGERQIVVAIFGLAPQAKHHPRI